MINRFKNSLFKPSLISIYKNDKKITVLLYLLLLIIFSMIPSIAYFSGQNSLDYNDKVLLQESFKNVDLPYEISNNKLVRTSGSEKFEVKISEDISIVFMDNIDNLEATIDPFKVAIVFEEDGVYYDRALSTKLLFNYSKYEEIKNFNFSDLKDDNNEAWDIAIKIAITEVKEKSNINMVLNIFVSFISLTIDLLVFAIIITFFQKLTSPKINFGEFFKLTIYLLTPYVVATVIGLLYSISILSYIGIIISVIFAGRVSRIITRV